MVRPARFLMPLGILLVAPSGTAFAGSVAVNPRADIVQPLILLKSRDLQFGRIAPGLLPGVVTVAPTGVRTAAGGAVLAGGTVSSAEFIGMGRRNQFVTMNFGAPAITITRVGGTETMVVTGFSNGSSAATGLAFSGPFRRISDVTGIFSIPVGGTLAVGANQAGGTYVGTFSLTVNYQ